MRMPWLPGGSIHAGFTCIVILIVLMVSVVMSGSWDASAGSFKEYEVKAVFLFNFAKFIEWPPAAFKDAQSAVTLCILGKDPFGDALDSLRDKTIEGRKLVIRRVSKIEEADKCHILFVSASEKDTLSHILKATRSWNILTVGDTKGFAESGVMINLISIENKMGFEINLDAAEHASLKISSKLLKLGKIIKEKN